LESQAAAPPEVELAFSVPGSYQKKIQAGAADKHIPGRVTPPENGLD
jgi:hypothetical protein